MLISPQKKRNWRGCLTHSSEYKSNASSKSQLFSQLGMSAIYVCINIQLLDSTIIAKQQRDFLNICTYIFMCTLHITFQIFTNQHTFN